VERERESATVCKAYQELARNSSERDLEMDGNKRKQAAYAELNLLVVQEISG